MNYALMDQCTQVRTPPPDKCKRVCDINASPPRMRNGNICEECLRPYSAAAFKCLCAGNGGSGDWRRCGNLNNLSTGINDPITIPECCHENINPQMVVDAFCGLDYEAIDGECWWYWQGVSNRINQSPDGANRNPVGGRKRCCPQGQDCRNPNLGYFPAGPSCNPGDTEGWRCQGGTGTAGQSCQHHRYRTVVHCSPKISTCPNRPSLFCEILPQYDDSSGTTPYLNCTQTNPLGQPYSKYNRELLRFCDGNCSRPDAKFTWCCNRNGPISGGAYNCVGVSAPSHSPRNSSGTLQLFPACPLGKVEWFRFYSAPLPPQNPGMPVLTPQNGSVTRICCNTFPNVACQAIYNQMAQNWTTPATQYADCRNVLGNGWYELGRMCGDNCDADDEAKITICCRP